MIPFNYVRPHYCFVLFSSDPSNAKLSDPRTVFGFPIMEVSQKPRRLKRSQVQGLRWGNWGDGLAGIDPVRIPSETAMDGRGPMSTPRKLGDEN